MLSMLNMGPKSKGAHRLKAKAAETRHLVPIFLFEFHDCIVIIVAVGCWRGAPIGGGVFGEGSRLAVMMGPD